MTTKHTPETCHICNAETSEGNGGAGTCEGLYTDITLCSDCASYTLDELGIDEDANEAETQDEYIAKVAADRLDEDAVVAYLRDIAESAGGAVDAWADEGLSETDAEELGLSGPMLAAADALTRRWAQRIISERPEAR